MLVAPNKLSIQFTTYPNITAFQSIILLSKGAPLMPAGGSSCNLLKSLINLFLAGVDILAAYCTIQTKEIKPIRHTITLSAC